MEFVKAALVLKSIVPPRVTSPFTASWLVKPPPRRMLSVPPVIVRFPIERVPIVEPSPGVIEPLLIVTAELVDLPFPEKTPPLTVMAPPELVPLSRSVPPLMVVVPV